MEDYEFYRSDEGCKGFLLDFLEKHYLLTKKFCEELELGSRVCDGTKALLEDFYESECCSRKPNGVVGASIVLVCEEQGVIMPKRRVALVSNVSEACLKRSYDDLKKYLEKKKSKKLRHL